MKDDEIRALIRREIRETVTPILMGVIVSNASNQRSSVKRMPIEGAISNLRNIQPFGISSRAPANTEGLIIPVNGDATHLNLVGHFDKTKPEGQDGETFLYDAFGHKVYLSQDKMQFGSENSANPMMLGDIVQQLLSDLIEQIANHTHIGNLGYETAPPTQKADFEALKASPVDDGLIISDKCFTER